MLGNGLESQGVDRAVVVVRGTGFGGHRDDFTRGNVHTALEATKQGQAIKVVAVAP